MKKKADSIEQRNSAIELLRIISMVIIVFHHFSIHGGFSWEADSITIPHFWYNFIIMGGKIGVDVFILISGYFLIKSNSPVFNLKRILKLLAQVFFYSVSLYCIFAILGMNTIGIKSLIRYLFPITFSCWWFASAYFALYLIHPFLNKLLLGIDKKTYQNLLVLMIICWSVIPTFTKSSFQGNSLIWFVTLYAVAGYARIYGFNPAFKAKHYFFFGIVFTALTYLTSVIFMTLGSKISFFSGVITYFYEQDKITVFLISLSLFMAFTSLKMNYHKWINKLASATFGVYLIHDNNFVRPWLWLGVFKNAEYQNTILLIPYSILVVLIVYICCTLIDLFRQRFVEKPFMRFVNKHDKEWEKFFEKIIGYCKTIIFGKSI